MPGELACPAGNASAVTPDEDDAPAASAPAAASAAAAALIEINDVPVHRQPHCDLHCAVLAWSLA